DPDDPKNRDEIRAMRTQKRTQRLVEVLGFLFAVGFVGAPFIASALTRDADLVAFAPIGFLLVVVVVSAVAVLRRKTGDRKARLRFLTSTTVISAAICMAFVVIKREVGIDALSFSRAQFDEPWRLVTSAFTHGGAAHIGGNMIALLLFGPIIDLRIGRLR